MEPCPFGIRFPMIQSTQLLEEDATPHAHELMLQHQNQIYTLTSRSFAILMVVQWMPALSRRRAFLPALGQAQPARFWRVPAAGWRKEHRSNATYTKSETLPRVLKLHSRYGLQHRLPA
jgi:hypothetical protein